MAASPSADQRAVRFSTTYGAVPSESESEANHEEKSNSMLQSPRLARSISSLASGVPGRSHQPSIDFGHRKVSHGHNNSHHHESSDSDSSSASHDEGHGSPSHKHRFDLMASRSHTLSNLFSCHDEVDDEAQPLLSVKTENLSDHRGSLNKGRRMSLVAHPSSTRHSHSVPPIAQPPPWARLAASVAEGFSSIAASELFEQLTNPLGKYRRLWLVFIFFFALYNAVSIPLRLAFRALWEMAGLNLLYSTIDYVGDFFCLLDIGLNFFTPYTHEMVYERNLSQIRLHYFKTWFFPDLLSSLPVDFFFLVGGWDTKTVLIVRLTRFIRFFKYDQYFKVWEQYATRAPQRIRFLKLIMGMLLILHWLGCLWIYCGYENGFGTSTWLPSLDVFHASVSSQYIFAFWWATNVVTQVGGDPGLPTSDLERFLDIFIAFLAVFVVAIVIGNVSELVSELNADENNLRARLQNLNHFMYTRRLPEELQNRIRNYYLNLWNRQGGVDSSNVMEELPSSLRTEVSLVMNQDILGKVPIFSNSSEGFINSLVAHLKPQTYAPKEFIVRQGDIGSEMYFISRGQVNVIANEKIVGAIKEGGFFGEISVLSDQSQRTASIQAINFCDVFVLTHEDMQMMFRSFPAEKAVILRVADTRRAKDLLRKALQDEQLFVRHSLKGFSADPAFVSLLMDLFNPVDLFSSDSPVMDENGVLDLDSFGYIFGPHQPADTLYFIGKGAVNIFAHRGSPPDAEGENGEDEEEPEFVCSLKEGDFVGEIGSEFYSVWAVVPFEYRRETIIFALSVEELGAIHDFYERQYKEEPKLRKRMKRALVCLLQRHRTAEDYKAAKAPPVVKEIPVVASDPGHGPRNMQFLWKTMSKTVSIQAQAHKRLSASSAHPDDSQEEFRSGTSEDRKPPVVLEEEINTTTDSEKIAGGPPPLDRPSTIITISSEENPSESSQPQPASDSPPANSFAALVNSAMSEVRTRPHSSSLPSVEYSPRNAPVENQNYQTTITKSPQPAPEVSSTQNASVSYGGSQSTHPTPRNAPVATRPNMPRALSTPMKPLGSVEPQSPLVVPTSPGISRSPQLSPRSPTRSPGLSQLIDQPAFKPLAVPTPFEGSALPSRPRKSIIAPRVAPVDASLLESPDFPSSVAPPLFPSKSRRQSEISVVQRALAAHRAKNAAAQEARTPSLKRPPSLLSPTTPTPASSGSLSAISPSGDPASPLPNSNPGSRRGSIASATSQFSFLLQLPMITAAQPTAAPTAPQPRSRRPSVHRRAPSIDLLSFSNKPELQRPGSRDDSSATKRSIISPALIVPQTPSTIAPPLSATTASRRMEFLDKALGALGHEELLLLLNKANLALYQRIQQTQGQSQEIII